jgi:hypothetical protein
VTPANARAKSNCWIIVDAAPNEFRVRPMNEPEPRQAPRVERFDEILETLTALGKACELDGDRYMAM